MTPAPTAALSGPPTGSLFGFTTGFAEYWANFCAYWRQAILTESGIVTSVLLLGAFGIFIITRGRWRK